MPEEESINGQWPHIQCPSPPAPDTGVTVDDKLQNIIDKAMIVAATGAAPEALACLNKAWELRQAQPNDPIGGANLVASASDKADAGDWASCKEDLDGVN